MKCPKCGSENVSVQVTNEVKIKNKHKGIGYWIYFICIGWFFWLMKWVIFTLPALIIAIFKPKKVKAVNKQVTNCVCQNCTYTWKA